MSQLHAQNPTQKEPRVKDNIEQQQDRPASPARRRIFQAAGAAGLAASLPGVNAAPAA